MEPKFQSSFIPKGPVVSSGGVSATGTKSKGRNLLSFIASIIFTISIIGALGVFGYKFYLKYSIQGMESDLESAYNNLEPETVGQLTDLDSRIKSTKELIARHIVLSPLFKFLEESTPTSVRFTELNYVLTDKGYELSMSGEARGYADLALLSDIFNKSDKFRNPIFSDFILGDRGDITFSFKATIDPTLISYRKEVENSVIPEAPINTETLENTASSTPDSNGTSTTASTTATSTVTSSNGN
ncbi:hypothetical protein GW944_00445 [Candidatus Parcubacteria bacterium]|nr:hypothetical protein [Candidatus Parcubacteria bacterium]